MVVVAGAAEVVGGIAEEEGDVMRQGSPSQGINLYQVLEYWMELIRNAAFRFACGICWIRIASFFCCNFLRCGTTFWGLGSGRHIGIDDWRKA